MNPHVSLIVLLNRARYLATLVDCYFMLTVDDNSAALARNIAKESHELSETLDTFFRAFCEADSKDQS